MNTRNNSIINDLDLLVNLLIKLKDRAITENPDSIDKSFFENFDQIISNYYLLKSELSDELMDKFGEPIQQIVIQMIDQLKHELCEMSINRNKINDIDRIDQLLGSDDLTEDEIDRLLDKRSQLIQSTGRT